MAGFLFALGDTRFPEFFSTRERHCFRNRDHRYREQYIPDAPELNLSSYFAYFESKSNRQDRPGDRSLQYLSKQLCFHVRSRPSVFLTDVDGVHGDWSGAEVHDLEFVPTRRQIGYFAYHLLGLASA